jgi:hypothetical protein
MAEKKPHDALRKLAQAEDAKKARAEYDAAAKALDANTARLRALRLEREGCGCERRAFAEGRQKEARQEGESRGRQAFGLAGRPEGQRAEQLSIRRYVS